MKSLPALCMFSEERDKKPKMELELEEAVVVVEGSGSAAWWFFILSCYVKPLLLSLEVETRDS
jgi:hypothetical protein